MIGRITTGSDFNGLFRYLLQDDKDAQLIGGDRVLLEPDAQSLARQFNWIAKTRSMTKKPVKHLSIGFAPADGIVDEETKVAIAETVVNELGYTNNQWVVIAHPRDDPGHDWEHQHDHIHVVINGIDFNSKRVKDSFDKTRLEKILRALEQEHGLTTVISSNQCSRRRPNTKQLNRYQRQTKEYNQQKRDAPPEIPIMVKLQTAIDAVSSDRPTMTLFIGRLQHLGIDVKPYITDKGRKRISYRLGDFKIRGSKLYNCSFPKLISQRGIDFDEVRDTPALEAACQGKAVAIDNQQLISWSEINKISDLEPSYWLPKPLKVLFDNHSNQELTEPWENLQQKLLDNYGIPKHISDSLKKANLLTADLQGKPLWHKRRFLDSKDAHFWFEINDSEDQIKKMVITSSPLETVSAYFVDRLINHNNCPCFYLSVDSAEQLNELDLTQFNTIVVNSSDKQLVLESIDNLVVEENVSSWQQNWLTHWNEIQRILESSAKKQSSWLKKTCNKDRAKNKQLEL